MKGEVVHVVVNQYQKIAALFSSVADTMKGFLKTIFVLVLTEEEKAKRKRI
jgi:hypothetical protein